MRTRDVVGPALVRLMSPRRWIIAATALVLLGARLPAQGAVILTGAPRPTAATAVDSLSEARLTRAMSLLRAPTFQKSGVAPSAADSSRAKVDTARWNAALAAVQRFTTRPVAGDALASTMLADPAILAILSDPTVPGADKARILEAVRLAASAVTAPAPEENASNYWAGAQMAYRLNGDGGISDNLPVSGNVAVQAWAPPVATARKKKLVGVTLAWLPDFELPFYTNVARPNVSDADSANAIAERNTRELLTGTEGIHLGTAPFIRWGGVGKNKYFVMFYGSLAWRLNTVRAVDTSKTVNLEQARLAGGVRLGIGHMKIGSAPGVLAVEFFQSRFLDADKYEQAFGKPRERLTGIESTFILPLGDQLAVLANHVAGRHTDTGGFLRVGLIVKREAGS